MIWYYTMQHLRYTVIAVTIGTAVALPLSYLALRRPGDLPGAAGGDECRSTRSPRSPSSSSSGRGSGSPTTSRSSTAMTLYTLVILVRNIVESVRSVPDAVVAAADGMGYRRLAPLRHRRSAARRPGHRRRVAPGDGQHRVADQRRRADRAGRPRTAVLRRAGARHRRRAVGRTDRRRRPRPRARRSARPRRTIGDAVACGSGSGGA